MGPNSRVAQFKQIKRLTGREIYNSLRWPPSLIAGTPAAALAALYMLPGAHYNDPEFSWKYAVAPSPMGFVQGRGLGPHSRETCSSARRDVPVGWIFVSL